MPMMVDLSKIMHNNASRVPVDGNLIIPDGMLVNTDIRRITPVKVSGYVHNGENGLELDLKASGTMVLPCSRTLKDVDYPFNIEINEVIDENSENSLEINQNSLDIFPIVWQNILVDVPLRVLAPDAKEESLEGDGWRLITEDNEKEKVDPRLSKLKDYINK